MKILHVITLAELGGAQSVVINLAEKSAENGDEVFVASSAHGEMWELLHPKVKQIKIKNLQHSIGFKDVLVAKELLALHKKIKPDVVHLHSSKIGILGRLAFPSAKIVYTIHGFDSIRVQHRKFLPLEKILQHRCAAIVGVSNYDFKNLKAEGITKNIHVIHNGIKDFTKTQPILTDPFSKFKKNSDTKVVLSISRISPQKRFDVFCKVAESLSQENVVFLWIGNKKNEKNIPKNVFLLGEIKDAFYYYKFADVAALFSNYEGLPMSLIEALCFSKPIIATKVGGISELLNENGALISNSDLRETQKTLTFMLNNQNIYNKFAKKSRMIFEERFNVDEMYNKYSELYSLIAKK